MDSFADNAVLITGGNSGIGLALGKELVRRGAHVTFADLSTDTLESKLQELEGEPGSATAMALDVTDLNAVKACVQDVVSRHGRLDLLFNNAGVAAGGETHDIPTETWNRLIDVNLRGVIHGIEAAYPQMLSQGFGHIANTACVAGLVPFPMTSAYSATKHAVVGLSAAMRAEAAQAGVRVSVICPGIVDTAMFDTIEYFGVDKQALLAPIGRAMMTPEACARKILRGVARNRSVITVGLEARLTWFLYRLAPRSFMVLAAKGYQLFRKRLGPGSNRS